MPKKEQTEKLKIVMVNEKGTSKEFTGRTLLIRIAGEGFYKRLPLEFHVEGGEVRILTNSKEWKVTEGKIAKGSK